MYLVQEWFAQRCACCDGGVSPLIDESFTFGQWKFGKIYAALQRNAAVNVHKMMLEILRVRRALESLPTDGTEVAEVEHELAALDAGNNDDLNAELGTSAAAATLGDAAAGAEGAAARCAAGAATTSNAAAAADVGGHVWHASIPVDAG